MIFFFTWLISNFYKRKELPFEQSSILYILVKIWKINIYDESIILKTNYFFRGRPLFLGGGVIGGGVIQMLSSCSTWAIFLFFFFFKLTIISGDDWDTRTTILLLLLTGTFSAVKSDSDVCWTGIVLSPETESAVHPRKLFSANWIN